ncbi:hypothetical protein FJV41_46660 [Myxococcus llanfairpwllgwyngyllgogerychwyrndrobwllllantysiliogogogochensis]|uniref:Uncharacterized protein n=1 Tax=Myxococcus llanfairpwllgwyngyllgogerychwyrndrobwllllantysiliogogogochensis TaxID=2590453 RepID=A0A540WJ60_9BACT|nr:hypothetical protein [Myxococcus llanfairpwllgwyngyllgogerychwyrndrobwllllantysiliogogogochensis]TQF09052.1 hypothetical protein FJV41_46660 [Myxococcus llanfairpwllgwyngyllgogerychwyrndrobwllllantysiliogogogochensis]
MDTYRVARLPARLRGFVLPDTSTQPGGYVEAGDYLVLEEKSRHPTPDTDYARLLVPKLSALDTWVCTRWRTQRYATFLSQESAPAMARLSFDSEPLAVLEERLTTLLGAFLDYRYDASRAYYPWALPGVRVPLAPPRLNNCCTFVEALLVKAFSEAHGAALSWDARRHRQMMIGSTQDYFSPVTAAVESGMALAAPSADVPPHPWTLIQGWRSQWGSGHTFLVLDHHVVTDKVLVLESNAGFGLDGVGYRGLGNLRDIGLQPPAQWWTRREVWTWRRICSTYPFRRQAWLKVNARTAAGR